MFIQKQVAALVVTVGPAVAAALTAELLEAEKVGIRVGWQSLDLHPGYRIPKVPIDRTEYLALRIEQYEIELQRDIATYTHYREQNLAALSAYDVCISSGNDPLSVPRTALRLKDAHIFYDLSTLVKLMSELENVKIGLVRAEPPQLALF